MALNHGIKSAVFMARKVGKRGRKGGGRNRGYWFRKDRGWFVTEGALAIPLCDDKGNCIKDAKDAKGQRLPTPAMLSVPASPRNGASRSWRLAASTSIMPRRARPRLRTLAEACYTIFAPASRPGFRTANPRPKIASTLATAASRRMGLTTLDVERWLAAHPGWKSHRTALQAVRRVLNDCVGVKALDANSLRGLKVPKVGQRETYLPPEVEQAIYAHCKRVAKRSGKERSPALALAIQVCVRTGCRPDIEFNSLEARHVEETPARPAVALPGPRSQGTEEAQDDLRRPGDRQDRPAADQALSDRPAVPG